MKGENKMPVKHFRPITPSTRNMTVLDYSEITKKTPEKTLLTTKKKKSGRNNYGRITVRHQGGGNRQKYRNALYCISKENEIYYAYG